ncbi:hypothetical protein NFI96_031597 [Prochilodus magdalenae]|nr:hypothetical protein NFI96_031597 [Prochilodus magdalenae]
MSSVTCPPGTHEHEGRCCDGCPEGEYVSSHCSDSLPTKCTICFHDTYMSQRNYLTSCMSCRQCHENQVELKPCMKDSNRECVCKEGFYCSSSTQGHCEHCRAVTLCPPGNGVSVQHTSTKDSVCSPCKTGTFNNVEDYKTPCLNHTNCAELGRPLLARGTTTTDAQCGALQHCHWMIPAGLWAGLIMTIIIFIALLYWTVKRKSKQTLSISGHSESYILPVLPPDIIKHPGSPVQPILYHKEESFNTFDCSLECDGITLTTLTASEKYPYSACQGGCAGSSTSDPSILQSEPQEDEWPGA